MLHSRNSSRPRARTATTPALGPAPRSTIHSTRSSQPITAMRAEFALPATSTRTITPFSSARDAMAATTRTISSTTTCLGMSTTASTVTSVTRAAKAVDKVRRTGRGSVRELLDQEQQAESPTFRVAGGALIESQQNMTVVQKHLGTLALLLSCAAAQDSTSRAMVQSVIAAREEGSLRIEITLSAPVKPS